MIVVVGRVTTDSERRAELVRLGEAVAAASREAAGCLGYRVHQATDDEDAVIFVRGDRLLRAGVRRHDRPVRRRGAARPGARRGRDGPLGRVVDPFGHAWEIGRPDDLSSA